MNRCPKICDGTYALSNRLYHSIAALGVFLLESPQSEVSMIGNTVVYNKVIHVKYLKFRDHGWV